MKLLDCRGQDVTKGVVEACPPGRILQSRLPNVATAITLLSDTAYFVYVGCTTRMLKVKFIEFYVNTNGSGAQVAEVGLFATANQPNKTNQGTNGIAKLTATGTLDSLTATGLKRNTTALNGGSGYIVGPGIPLWAGIRTAMATTQPVLGGLCMDFSQGLVLSTATAGQLTNAGPWTGSLIAIGTYLNSAVAPDLRITLD